jgi:hypothetical protein
MNHQQIYKKKEYMMSNERCMHGMLKGQCGVCQRWDDNSWPKKEESELDNHKTREPRKAQS